jgi:hypothetical protein
MGVRRAVKSPATVKSPVTVKSYVVLFTVLWAGCAAPRFPMPMTAADLAGYDSGPALVAYLSQPDASPTVCDLQARGPHLALFGEDAREWLVRGLAEGRVQPALWRRCVDALLHRIAADDAASLIDAIGHAWRKLVKDSDFEQTPAYQARVDEMQRLYLERKNGLDGHPGVIDALFNQLRRALDKHRLGPAAARFGEDLIATVDLEHGKWSGREVDLPMIDGLFAAGDEKLLRRFADRLPQPTLRDESRRRVIRLHIAASPFAEVRAQAAAVEEQLMQHGANPLSPTEHAPVRGWLDTQKVPMRGVLVRQHVWDQTATLLGYAGDRPGVSVLPELSLRGGMQVEVKGISRPITLCAPPKELDPSPCLAPRDVKLENPAAYLDKGGAFHFVDQITMRDAVDLAQQRDRFLLPVSVAGVRLFTFEWRLYYERPEDLIFSGPSPGANGPDLRVMADHRDPARFIFTVTAPGGAYLAVVESPDAAAFHVVSRGAQGYLGAPGTNGIGGANGADGASASCPSSSGGNGGNGGDGGDGGPGGPGGDGGDGGDVDVQAACGGAPCGDAIGLLQQTVYSEAGAGGYGGAGGAGGPGGSGGSGGSGTTCTDSNGNTTSVSGGSAGMSGRNGSNGPDGPPGYPGRPGRVNYRVVP